MDNNESKKMWNQALRYSSIGLELGLIYGLFIYLGQRLDNHNGLSPWCQIGAFLFATISAVLIIIGIVRDYNQTEKTSKL